MDKNKGFSRTEARLSQKKDELLAIKEDIKKYNVKRLVELDLVIKACEKELLYCQNARIISSMIDIYLKKAKALISYYRACYPNGNNNVGDSFEGSGLFFNDFVAWSSTIPSRSYEEVEDYIKTHSSDKIVWSYIFPMMRDITPEQMKRLMVLSSGFIPEDEADYDRIFRTQKIRYCDESEPTRDKLDDILVRLPGKNGVFLETSDKFIDIDVILDRIVWPVVPSENLGPFFAELFGTEIPGFRLTRRPDDDVSESNKGKKFERDIRKNIPKNTLDRIKTVSSIHKTIVTAVPKFY